MTRAPDICALAVALAAAVSAHPAAGWSYASSDHFEAYTTGNDAHAREAIAEFERVHAFFERSLDLARTSAPRTTLVVFSSPKEYAPYRPNAVANAFYENAPGGDYIVMQGLDADAFPLVVHEYAHLMIRRAGGEYPLWLNEGLAEFFSTMTPQGSKMRLGLAPVPRLQTLAKGPALIPLDRLFAIDHQSPEYNEKGRADVFYAECWALTHMLLADERYRDRSRDLLASIAAGTPVVQTLMAMYGKSLAAISNDLDRYVRRESYGYTLADAPTESRAMHVTSRAAGDVEAGIVLAAMLGWQHGRENEARRAFEVLATRAPDDLRLAESRGLLESMTDHLDAARPYLAHAVALGSGNPLVLRSYAGLISSSDPQQEEALLTRALAAAPDDVDVRIDVARMLIERRRGAEAMKTLATVSRVPADRAFAFFEALTMAAVQAGQIDDAKAAAARTSGAARSDADRAQAVTLMREAGTAQPERAVTGRLTNVICSEGPTIIEVKTDGTVLRLVIDNPRGIRVSEGSGASITLDCGQQDKPIHVAYVVAVDNARNTVGAVRMIEFLK